MSQRLIQSAPLRGKQNHRLAPRVVSLAPIRIGTGDSWRNTFRLRRDAQLLNTFKDRFRLEDHPLAAAKWAVIHGAMLIAGKLPQVVDARFHQARFPRPAQNPEIQRPTKKLRKDREKIDLHLADLNTAASFELQASSQNQNSRNLVLDTSYSLTFLRLPSLAIGALISSMPSGSFMRISFAARSTCSRYASAYGIS